MSEEESRLLYPQRWAVVDKYVTCVGRIHDAENLNIRGDITKGMQAVAIRNRLLQSWRLRRIVHEAVRGYYFLPGSNDE